MDPITGIVALKGIQTVSNLLGGGSRAERSDFEAVLSERMRSGEGQKTGDQELFAERITEGLRQLGGPESANRYDELLRAEKAKIGKAGGPRSLREAAENALEGMVDARAITSEQAAKIRSEAAEDAKSTAAEAKPIQRIRSLEDAIERARIEIQAMR